MTHEISEARKKKMRGSRRRRRRSVSPIWLPDSRAFCREARFELRVLCVGLADVVWRSVSAEC